VCEVRREEDVGAVEDRPGGRSKRADRLSCEGQTLSYICIYAGMERSMAKRRGGRYLGVFGGRSKWAVKLRER
jgi:hypothetical protein